MTRNNVERVLHVLAPAREGGLERVVLMLAAAQAPHSAAAVVLTPRDVADHPLVADLRARDVSVTVIPVEGRAYLRELSGIAQAITRESADVVHTHGYRADILGGIAARRANRASVSTVHGFTGGGAKNRFYEWLQCRALRRADAVISVSRPIVERLASSGVDRERIHLVPNAYRPTVPLLSRTQARAQLGISGDHPVVGWVGRVSHEKGPDIGLKGVMLAPDWRLSVVGNGPLKAILSENSSERTTWHGAVHDAGSLLAAFDALLLSSRTEGTPIILLEAMAAGVPVIATQVGGVPDVVSPREAILVPPEDPGSIAEALAQIAADPAAAKHRAENARLRLDSHYNPERWLDSVCRVYAAARARRPSRHQ